MDVSKKKFLCEKYTALPLTKQTAPLNTQPQPLPLIMNIMPFDNNVIITKKRTIYLSLRRLRAMQLKTKPTS